MSRMKCPALFLEVYTTSVKALELYEKEFGFAKVTEVPCHDDVMNKDYWIMGLNVGK
jgi:ribosomal protein S18 acetylase RimI-like enzyme